MKPTLVTLLVLFLTLLVSCSEGVVYDRYANVPVSEWNRNDTLLFDVPPVAASGVYGMSVGIRITGAFPFKAMTLLVRTVKYPGGEMRCDTVECALVEDSGHPLGEGVGVFETSHQAGSMHLNKGDSLHISVIHNMRLEDLPGITGIGISLRDER